MPAESSSLSLANRLAIPAAHQLVRQGYYRSKLFIAPYTSNLLTAAASPLFSLLERLSISPTLPTVETIRDNIEHELRAFYSRLNAANYNTETMAIAYYLLTASIDELLAKSYLRLYEQPAEFKSFTPLTQDGAEPQRRFFEIIQHIKESPGQYLDLIELGYYCLIAGFEGEQHFRSDGRQTLDNLIEELYLLIKNHRVNKPQRLNQSPSFSPIQPPPHKPFWLTAALTLGLLFSSFWLSQSVLNHKAKTVLAGHLNPQVLEHHG